MTARPARWRRVVLDANVLVQAPIRDTLLWAAEEELLTVFWGPTILDEVARTLRERLLARHADAAARVARLLAALAATFPRALVPDEPPAGLSLAVGTGRADVDPKDGHVLAAALQAGAGAIVTYNRRHFPATALAPHSLVALTPDQLLVRLAARDPAALRELLRQQAADLRPPPPVDQLLDRLERDVPRFVALVRASRL
jgi:predicted nucleic acid-binding protein